MKKKIAASVLGAIFATSLFLYFVLKNTPEHFQHNMRGGNNTVYNHKDGHSEAVFDSNGKLVKECINMASYNYANRKEKPFLHFYQDTLPWIMWGNCREDPTTVEERRAAFFQDLVLGIKITLGMEKS